MYIYHKHRPFLSWGSNYQYQRDFRQSSNNFQQYEFLAKIFYEIYVYYIHLYINSFSKSHRLKRIGDDKYSWRLFPERMFLNINLWKFSSWPSFKRCTHKIKRQCNSYVRIQIHSATAHLTSIWEINWRFILLIRTKSVSTSQPHLWNSKNDLENLKKTIDIPLFPLGYNFWSSIFFLK